MNELVNEYTQAVSEEAREYQHCGPYTASLELAARIRRGKANAMAHNVVAYALILVGIYAHTGLGLENGLGRTPPS